MKKVVMIVAPTNFRDEELLEPKEVLEESGVEVSVASKGTDLASGMLGAMVSVNLDYTELKVNDYDGIIFVGGSGAARFFDDSTAHKIAKEALDKDKVLGAICIAPSILANAGLLEGKKATVYASEKTNLENKGALYQEAPVVVDEKIVTANGPKTARAFGEAILSLL